MFIISTMIQYKYVFVQYMAVCVCFFEIHGVGPSLIELLRKARRKRPRPPSEQERLKYEVNLYFMKFISLIFFSSYLYYCKLLEK